MLVREFECRSIEQAVIMLGGRPHRKVCGNTVLHKSDGGISVLLHGHPIIFFRIDGSAMIDSCGYRTNTTKHRLNRCLPNGWRVCQRSFEWYLWNFRDAIANGAKHAETPFIDGMAVPQAVSV